MATVPDAYALIALVRGESAADEVELILRRGGAAVSSVNVGEAIDVLHPASVSPDASCSRPSARSSPPVSTS